MHLSASRCGLRGLVVFLLMYSPLIAANRPNVLFLASDDLNDWLGCMGGHPQVKTPHLDRLAARGTVFLNAHCQSPLCNPSRASLMTGLRPSTIGVYALEPWFRTSEPLKNWVTLPQYFRNHGYQTLTTGKIYHDAYPPKEARNDGIEFDIWGFHGGAGPHPKKRFVHPSAGHPLMDWGPFPDHDEQLDDSKIADWAIDRLKSMPQDKPFFLCVGFRRPHVPCFAPQKWFDMYPEDTLILPPFRIDDRDDTPLFSWYLHWDLPEPRLHWLKAHKEWRSLVRAYLACVSFMDGQVGRVLDALEATGQADNTIIVFWGDNGWHLGEKSITGKNTLWDRSTRVPLIFAGPGVTPKGRCTQPAELLDMYPTLVELCKLPSRDVLEGHSLVPQLKDASTERPWPAITTHGPNNHGIRSERWRYIRYADESEELYDMQADPNEWNNLAADPNTAQIKEELANWLPKMNKPPIPGSVSRLIELRDGQPYWEGKPIPLDAKPR